MDLEESVELVSRKDGEIIVEGSYQGLTITPEGLHLKEHGQEKARMAMYASHGLSMWGQRAWEFLVGLVMIEIYPSSLFLVALFGICDSAAVTLLSPYVGYLVDSLPRYKAACSMYLLQNVSVLTSGVGCSLLLWRKSEVPGNAFFFHGMIAMSILAACLSSLGATGASISVEREWTKTLCRGNDSDLAAVNAVMKRVDLLCLIASPIVIGLFMTHFGAMTAIIFFCSWNIVSWPFECWFLHLARQSSPWLKERKSESECHVNFPKIGMPWLTGLLVYFQQPFTASAFALALIYLTVMSFGTVMTGYLAWTGVSEFKLSIFRGLGAVSGVCATLAFPMLYRNQGLQRSGLLGIWVQFISLLLSIVPYLLKYIGMDVSVQLSSTFLMSGLALSRFGLWLFDLACNQIIQDEAPRELLGNIFGTQQSLQSLFQTISFAITLAAPDPAIFFFLMAGSTLVVLAAAMLFTISILK